MLDEAHQILSDVKFRPQFLKLNELADFKAQLIYLTASLPKRLEAQFLIQSRLPPDTLIVHAPSNQPQISYIKLTFNTMNTDHNCVSHSKIPTNLKAHNEASWKDGHSQWIAVTTGMICGIDNANVGAVIFVGIGYGLINLYQGAGRSGRDGTPSWAIVLQSSNSYMAIPSGGLKDDSQCIEESHTWLHINECRRIGFSSLFDNARVTCLDLPNAHLCDFCDPDLELVVNLHSKIVDPMVEPEIEEEYHEMDSFLMSMDFNSIPELSAPASTTTTHRPTPLTHAPSTDSILSDEDPFRFAPTPGEPSMQIQRQVAYYHATLSTKEAKSKALNTFTTMLLGMCPLCWAYQGILVPRHKEKQWIQCRGPLGEGYMQMGIDRPFKKKIKFPPYKFCWRCHLPQDEFMPPSHNFGSGKKG